MVIMPRTLAVFFIFLLLQCALFADWTPVSSSPKPSPAGIDFIQREVTNGDQQVTLWIVSFKDGKAKMQDMPQRLLFGDSTE